MECVIKSVFLSVSHRSVHQSDVGMCISDSVWSRDRDNGVNLAGILGGRRLDIEGLVGAMG